MTSAQAGSTGIFNSQHALRKGPCLPQRCSRVLTPGPEDVTPFANRIFEGVMSEDEATLSLGGCGPLGLEDSEAKEI